MKNTASYLIPYGQLDIGPYEDLLTSVKRRKLKLYGHVTRSSELAKTILQGTVQGGRRRGRQRKRWEDNIKEWTGLEWNILLKAENREEWRKLVLKSTVVPQGSARLIIIIAFKGAIRDLLTAPRTVSSAYHVQVSCYVPLGTKGQLSY